MPNYELRPSKPHALFIAAGVLAILVFGITQMVREGEFQWFFVLWVVVGLVMIGGALAQGFSRRRATAMDTTGDDSLPVRYRLAHNKPLAVVGSIVGAGILVYAVVRMAAAHSIGNVLFFAFFGVAIICFNLWTAFGKRGSAYTVTRRD